MMKVSVVTVNYNGGKTLKRTIESILNQTYNSIEYIIIDGKSNDNSIDIIKSYEEKFKRKNYEYKWISEEDTGIYNAMNKGIKLATGEIIGILNSDDWYEKDTVNLVVNEFKKEDLKMVYGLLRTVEDNKFKNILGEYDCFGRCLHPTVFLKKEIYEKYGYFNEKYKIAADIDLLFRFESKNVKCKFIEKILANFSLEGVSTLNKVETKMESLEIEYNYGIISKYKKNRRKIQLVVTNLKYFISKKIKNLYFHKI